MMGYIIQGRRTLQSPPQPSPTTPINHQQHVSSNLAKLLGFAAGGSTPDQATRHNEGSGERVDLDPINYLLLKQKVKHLDITDYINATGQDVEELLSSNGDTKLVVKAVPKKIQLEM